MLASPAQNLFDLRAICCSGRRGQLWRARIDSGPVQDKQAFHPPFSVQLHRLVTAGGEQLLQGSNIILVVQMAMEYLPVTIT